jgi:hypothetical protein
VAGFSVLSFKTFDFSIAAGGLRGIVRTTYFAISETAQNDFN